MPVVAEIVSQPSSQDLIDLEKTYEGDIGWVAATLESKDRLIAGRFNDRLVCAFRLRENGDHWQLDRLQVRAITRRRGVARQTLHSALKTLGLSRPVQVDLNAHPKLKPLFHELGFTDIATGELRWAP